MLYSGGADWRRAARKRVLLFGMSGLGKTHVAAILRRAGGWFHYSVDYRIGTRYMDEHIVDNFKREAIRNPFLRELLLSDSIYIASNITFDNLAPLATYLGKPGDPARGGLAFAEYRRRQEQHRYAEMAALMDTPHFVDRAEDIYGYWNFVCDSGGSICEIVDPEDPADPVMTTLAGVVLPVWIEGTDAHAEALKTRFDAAPKPMYYRREMLEATWRDHLAETGACEGEVDPDAFLRRAYARALAERRPRYAAMAGWGVRIGAEEAARVADAAGFEALIGEALDRA